MKEVSFTLLKCCRKKSLNSDIDCCHLGFLVWPDTVVVTAIFAVLALPLSMCFKLANFLMHCCQQRYCAYLGSLGWIATNIVNTIFVVMHEARTIPVTVIGIFALLLYHCQWKTKVLCLPWLLGQSNNKEHCF